MRFSLWPNPERTYAETRALVLQAEAAGWHAAYVADHFMDDKPIGEPATVAMLESTSTMAALAEATSSIRLGTLVASATYRHPAVLAAWAATVDQISDGRVILGLGAGWQINEHHAYGIELGEVRTRIDRFAEYVSVVQSLLSGGSTTFDGTFFRLEDAPCEPGPVQQPLPLLLGVKGERRTMALAAQHASIWNSWCTPEELRNRNAVLDRHCNTIGRDPSEIQRTTQALVIVTSTEEQGARLRSQSAGRPLLAGTATQLIEQLGDYVDSGCDEFIVPGWTLGAGDAPMDAIALLSEAVLPEFA